MYMYMYIVYAYKLAENMLNNIPGCGLSKIITVITFWDKVFGK